MDLQLLGVSLFLAVLALAALTKKISDWTWDDVLAAIDEIRHIFQR
ncbi:hypothetical protein OHA25_60210 (plasmid) [Nonomuraea sp. NBC_00507]